MAKQLCTCTQHQQCPCISADKPSLHFNTCSWHDILYCSTRGAIHSYQHEQHGFSPLVAVTVAVTVTVMVTVVAAVTVTVPVTVTITR